MLSITSDQSTEDIDIYEYQQWANLNRRWYPHYHIAPPIGWLSVPHGLCQHKGIYHVFYQHHPFHEEWGLMHWGHATSTDLVHWENQGIALTPGESFDKDGCFSGSAVSFEGKMYLFYTGHQWRDEAEDGIFQQQCMAVSEDGLVFKKIGVIIRPPKTYAHFRDPKVFFDAGRWWMVLGARDRELDIGVALLFCTTDINRWDESTYMVLGSSSDKNVFMWECPDFFITEGVSVLLCCPQGLKPVRHQYRNRFQSGYMLGQWIAGEPFVAQTKFRELDRGHDFYAPQTFRSDDGRQILIGWLGIWESPMPSRAFGWSGMLTIPRELALEPNGGEKLMMRPIQEIEKLRGEGTLISPVVLEGDSEVLLVHDCTSHEILVTFNVDCSSAEKYGVWIGKGCEIYIDAQAEQIVLYRHFLEHMVSGYRSCPLANAAVVEFRLFVDRSSVELFVNDGEEVFSSRIYCDGSGDTSLKLFSIAGPAVVVKGMVYELHRDSIGFSDEIHRQASNAGFFSTADDGASHSIGGASARKSAG